MRKRPGPKAASERTPPAAEPAAGLTPLKAYAEDVGRGVQLPQDGKLLGIATLVYQARFAGGRKRAAELLASAAVQARQFVRDDDVRDGPGYEGRAARSSKDILRLFAEAAEETGRPRLGQSVIAALLALTSNPAKRMSLRVDVARSNMKLGDTDLALEQARAIRREAKRRRLKRQAIVAGFVELGCHLIRGNLQEGAIVTSRALREARRMKVSSMLSMPLNATAMLAGYAGRHGEAIEALWSAHVHCRSKERAIVASNLAQVLFDAGYPHEARIVCLRCLSKPVTVRVGLALLAGFAISSAELGDRDGVEWAYDQVRRIPGGPSLPREYAVGIHASAEAFKRLGDVKRAKAIYAEADEIIDRYGFHDLKFRDDLVKLQEERRTRRSRPAVSSHVVDEIRELDAELPEAVEVV